MAIRINIQDWESLQVTWNYCCNIQSVWTERWFVVEWARNDDEAGDEWCGEILFFLFKDGAMDGITDFWI